MGFVASIPYRHRIGLLIFCGALALLIALLFTLAAHPETATAQISPLSPLTVATPLPQVVVTDTPSPLPPPQTGGNLSSTAEQSTSPDRNPNQTQNQQPLVPLGQPAQASPSLVLVSVLLVGLVLLVVAVFVARRRE